LVWTASPASVAGAQGSASVAAWQVALPTLKRGGVVRDVLHRVAARALRCIRARGAGGSPGSLRTTMTSPMIPRKKPQQNEPPADRFLRLPMSAEITPSIAAKTSHQKITPMRGKRTQGHPAGALHHMKLNAGSRQAVDLSINMDCFRLASFLSERG